ncbi:unnamed protein product [Clonostachys chloroleuca]|uniref:Uncharacterized protein n=1 Tax=Clonostachys chloroleuca TaxID=1926264 RepID=A0AA35QE71_9HYPO|nr:unnamed protein product [Clonostachys chloroleuca]
MTRTASGSTAATSVASGSETKHKSITALCALDIPTVKIGSQEDPSVAINNIQEAFLTKITGVTLENFLRWNESESRRGRLFFYSSEYEVLIIKYPSAIHEYLHLGLCHKITRNLSENPDKEIIPLGSTTFKRMQGGNVAATAAGEGDSILRLADRGKNNGWPTFVIEAGWTQNRAALVAKAHWWFEASNNAVKIVLLIKATPLQIQIEKWKTSPLPRPITRLYQREATNLYPKIHPPILTISRASANSPPNEYRVTGTPLRLEFRDVFLRDPVPPEGDILVEESFFRKYAEQAWQEI